MSQDASSSARASLDTIKDDAKAAKEREPVSPSSAPSSPSGLPKINKLERIYILVASLMDHARSLAVSLPPREAPDSEVDDVDLVKFVLELHGIVSAFTLEYAYLGKQRLDQLGVDFFFEEAADMSVGQRRRELSEKGGELTAEEEIEMRRNLRQLRDLERAAKKGKYPPRKTAEENLHERIRASVQQRLKKG